MLQSNHLSGVINISHPHKVLQEVKGILAIINADIDLKPVEEAFNDALALFKGEYPGYHGCNTYYHDQHHTLDALLSMVRLMHGASCEGVKFSESELILGAISALFHDSGYMQAMEDNSGTGAKYTATHIQRSIDFLLEYMKKRNYSDTDMATATDILNCTGLNTCIAEIRFVDKTAELLGKMMGTADLLGQMSDRYYLEKLLYLYQEFREGGISGYNSELELLQKTTGFFNLTEQRFKNELGGVCKYMQTHYSVCFGYDYDPYQVSMLKNLSYLEELLAGGKDYSKFLRRGKIVRFARMQDSQK